MKDNDVKPIKWSSWIVMFFLFALPMALFYTLYIPVFGQPFESNGIYLYMAGMALCFFCGYLAHFIKGNVADSFTYWDHSIERLGPLSLDTHISINAERLSKLTKKQITWVRKTNIKEYEE